MRPISLDERSESNGGPSNDKYQAFEEYVTQRDTAVRIPDHVAEELGESPEAIATSLDISVAAIHSALAYAFHNPAEMREIVARNRQLYESDSANRLIPDDAS